MAGQYLDFWRIVKPTTSKSGYVAANPDDFKLYSNFSWYTKVMKGAGSRFAKYQQYKNMDGDVFVARALDTIAEEMTTINIKTNLPFDIEYQHEVDKEVPERITMTVRAALRHWCDLHELDNRLFDIARIMIKYGDCFFRKRSDLKEWEYVEPNDVIGVSIDKQTNKVQFYQLKKGGSGSDKSGSVGEVEIVPASGMIHFTLSSGFDENAPFGDSVLFPTIKAYRHLTLLEDAVIIYRIVRAPERRVFMIDVGNMPQQRAKAYLESIKTEIRQKRVPNESGGQEKVDGVYNPMCLALGTKIPLLDGRTVELNELIAEHAAGKQNWVFSCDPESGKLVPGLISWAGVTRKNAELVEVTLDNGKLITCTPDHKFPTLNRGFVEAKDLTAADSLISYESREQNLGTVAYQQVFDHDSKSWKYTHRIVAEFFKGIGKHQQLSFSPEFLDEEKNTVHHIDFNAKNNHPANLTWMHKTDHILYHSLMKKEWWAAVKGDAEKLDALKLKISKGLKKYYAELPEEARAKLSTDAKARIDEWMARLSRDETWVEKLKASHCQNGQARQARMQADPAFKASITANIVNNQGPLFNNRPINVTREVVTQIARLVKQHDLNRETAFEVVSNDACFKQALTAANQGLGKGVKFSGKLTEKVMRVVYEQFGYKGWKHFKEASETYNHAVVSVRTLAERQDTGCITIDGEHKYHTHHTFALDAGIFTKNSMTEDYFFMQTPDGRGSKVDTLAGGENLGEIADLKFFQSKFLQGLRIPSSYMRGSDDTGAQVQDGKVGVAYIEELRFANYVKRLQQGLNKIFDAQFKAYMKTAGINIDPEIFKLKLVDPQNFQVYKQAEVDEKLISNFNNLKEVKYLSPRQLMRTILNWSDDDIQANEVQRKQELGIPDGGYGGLTELRMLYDPAWLEKPPEIKVHASFNDFSADTQGSAPDEEEEPVEGDESTDAEGEEGTDAADDIPKDGKDDEPPELDDIEKEAK